MTDPLPPKQPGRVLEAILLAVAFAVAHTQSPLFYSNQNQYFLHGMAAGGYGQLSHDWLAGHTTDPTPVFSALVAAGFRYLGEWSFQVAYFLLLTGYFLSMRWLVAAMPGVPDSRGFRVLWAALFTAAHAAILRVASVQLWGVDYPWFFQAGVAGQYVLGPGLQPSAFGVLLVTGLAAFANRRPVLAAFLVGLACGFHSTYLFPAAMLLLGFGIALFRENLDAGPTAFRALLAASAVVVPVAAYTLFTFGPGDDQKAFEEAQRILAFVRIPHHTVVTRWFDLVAGLQLAWAGIGLALLCRSRLFLVLLVAAACGLALTLAQYESGNPTFALAFPWRISVVLVPVATAVIAARLAALVPETPRLAFGAGIALFLSLGGVWVMVAGMGYRAGEDEKPLHDFVRETAGPDNVFLLPVRIPAVGTGRGAMSATFTPPPRPKPGSNLVPVDLQRFRLHTGARIYADFKSVPYKDVEVLEWLRRMKQTEAWYDGDWSAPERLQELRGEGITHVVTPADKPLSAPYLEEVHSDPAYIVYRLK
jgi:hypothetical protein